MGFLDVARRIGFLDQNTNLNGKRRALMDTLESRSMLSASPSGTGFQVSTSAPDIRIAATALKATVTYVKIKSPTSVIGAEVTISAAVVARSAVLPTGTVTFMAGNTVLGTKTLVNGAAKIATTLIPTGTSVITAVYSGAGKFAASTSAGVSHVVALPASTTKLSVTSGVTTTFGLPTTLLARVGSAAGGAVPTGRVAFYDGGTILGSKVVNSLGAARFAANFLYAGSHDLKAIYLGSTAYLGHRSGVTTVAVNPPTLSTASDGLRVASIVSGTGTGALASNYITVDYTLYVNGALNQTSVGSAQKFTFRPDGADPSRSAIAGFSEGLVGAKVGEKRVLVVPPSLGYGANANGNIPGNSTLVFVVDVLAISATSPTV